MIGLVVVTHGRLAIELIAAMEHVVGAQQQIMPICIGPEDNMEQRRQDILTAVKQVNDGKGVIVCTDMFGGTQSNLAISIMELTGAEVIAGVNLPMLVKLASLRGQDDVNIVANAACEAARKYISVASALLTERA